MHLEKAENKIIAGIIDRLDTDRIKLKKILDANDDRLDKASGRNLIELQCRVDMLQSAYDSMCLTIADLTRL